MRRTLHTNIAQNLKLKLKTHLHLPEFSSEPAWGLRGVLEGRCHQ